MDILYANKKLQKVCTDAIAAEKAYGKDMACKIHQRIDQISASEDVDSLVQFHIGRCHSLSQNRSGQYAMDLIHPYRLVFEVVGDKVQIANILEIVDYH